MSRLACLLLAATSACAAPLATRPNAAPVLEPRIERASRDTSPARLGPPVQAGYGSRHIEETGPLAER